MQTCKGVKVWGKSSRFVALKKDVGGSGEGLAWDTQYTPNK